MSVAVAVQKNGEVIVAADSLTVFGTTRVPPSMHVARKVIKVGSSYLAATGWGVYEDIIEDFIARRKITRLAGKREIHGFFMKLWKDLHDVYSFVNDQCGNKDESPFGHLDSSFMVANRKGIFYVAPDMSITEFARFFAIGSGGQYSLGALHVMYEGRDGAEELGRKAVETAIAFCAFCGGEVRTWKVGRR